MHEVTLLQMLDARENRAFRQNQLLKQYNKPLLCFTMNIAGPVKNTPLIKSAFEAGCHDFEAQLLRFKTKPIYKEIIDEITGLEAFYVIDMNPIELKRITCELEDYDELGRLYDMDIITTDSKIDRTQIGLSARKCLICGNNAKECSSRRIHSVSELQQKTQQIIEQTLCKRKCDTIASIAQRALLYEVCVTPKPGLVDRSNSGSHSDMDIYTFMNSSSIMYPYFYKCAQIGMQTAQDDATQTFSMIKSPARICEANMLYATNAVNTHKGAIFTLGIISSALARLDKSLWKESDIVAQECAKMTKGIVANDFKNLTKDNAKTVGQKLYLEYGITGVRGQIEEGLPAVLNYGLPVLEQSLSQGKSNDEAGSLALMAIIANTTDTNMICRTNIETQRKKAQEAKDIKTLDQIKKADDEYIALHLSPGGSADLLAASWMLHFAKQP